ncbi:hypothetical protein OLMES_2443 [Oleiphilus messinensis]|uniref:MAPEG family protein n=2 Tax=Oleiphilus messinensis TaxID=141451 RepID=A0A1Y0IAQ3_9GAMM|nr:hypothetical protein OLMES_2443 [Oleiphilus messinensis]
MTSEVLFHLMLGHLVWVAILYVALTVVRAPFVWSITVSDLIGEKFAEWEPRISANLSNQFEWPVFFYVGALLAFQSEKQSEMIVVFSASLFLIGRIVHSVIQIGLPSVRLRGVVFMPNFLAVLGVWFGLFM